MKNSFSAITLRNMVVAIFYGIAATCLFSACRDDDNGKIPPYNPDETMADSRTILAYMVAENSLSSFVAEDMNEMVAGMGKTNLKKGDNLILFVDDTSNPRIYHINGTDTVTSLKNLKPEKEFEEDFNSASVSKFGMIVDYMKEKYPAESYGLVMWSHASGWIPPTQKSEVSSKRKAFAIDNGKNSTSNSGYQMDICEMARMLEKKCYFDFIFFDACFMQTIEVDYELRKCTRYVISSPAEIPGPGADYNTMIPAMFKAENWASIMVDTYYKRYENDYLYGVVISAVETAGLDNFASYMKSVVDMDRNSFINRNTGGLLNYFDFLANYYSGNMPDCFDIKGLAKGVLSDESYSIWQTEFDKIIVNCKFTPTWFSIFGGFYGGPLTVDAEQCGGVSMFVPITWRYNQYYGADQFKSMVLDTQWGKYIWEYNN